MEEKIGKEEKERLNPRAKERATARRACMASISEKMLGKEIQ